MKETGHCFDDEEVTLKQTCSPTPSVPQNPPSSFFKYVKPDPQSPDLLYIKKHKSSIINELKKVFTLNNPV